MPGLGFRYDTDPRWPQPNPTGLEGVFESFTPPHYKDLRDAERNANSDLAARSTRVPGPWKDSPTARKSAQVHDERFKRLIAVQAQYMFDTFGKFPATVPSVYILMYLQGTARVLRQAVQARCLFADARPASCALARRRPSGMTLRAAVSARARGSPNAAPRPRRLRR